MEDSTLFVGGLQNILKWASCHVVEIIVFLSIFIEVSKIKLNPISAIVKFMSRPIHNEIELTREEFKKDIKDLRDDLVNQIDSLRKDQEAEKEAINELIYSNEMAEISRIRWTIIEFSNSISNGQLHVRDEYRHMKDEYKKYEILIDKYNLENGIVTEEIEKITKHYNDNKNTPSVYF